jgi:hypothetical protein
MPGVCGHDTVTRKEDKNELGSRGRSVDAYFLPATATFELHDACNAGEEGVVFAETHIETGKELCPSLTDQNRSGLHSLSAVGLDPKILRVTIAPVSS